MSRKICIYGAGGFGREILCCLIDAYGSPGDSSNVKKSVCFMVDDEYLKEREIMGVQVIARSEFVPEKYDVIVSVGDPGTRKRMVEGLPKNTAFTTIIHPTAIVSEWVEIGEGSIITAGCILTCNIKIGKHAHLNLLTTVGHDCTIGDYFTTAPAVNISGNGTFGDCVYFGTNAAVREKINICDDAIIGMGGIVVKDIIEPGVYVGNPAKIKKAAIKAA